MPAATSTDIKIDFVGIGAPKCGTTWLAACLDEHPQLCMAEPTALNYFCEQTIWPEFRAPGGLGADWLKERFARCQSGERLIEISPNYLYDETAPSKIFRHNPECRLLITFRHPVDLISSFYFQIAKESLVPETVEGFLREYPEVSRIGLYFRHLQPFLRIFPWKQLHFVLYDDIQRQPSEVVRDCYEFFGVDSAFQPPSLNRQINERRVPRSRAVMAAMNKTRHFLQENTSEKLWQALVWKTGLYRVHDWFLQRNLKPFRPAPMSDATRQELLAFYREDTQALAGLLGRDLSAWEI